MNHRTAVVAVVAAILSRTSHLAAQNDTSPIERQTAMAATIAMRDWSQFAGFLDSRATYIHSFGRVDSREELLRNIAVFPAIPQWEYRNVREVRLGDVALLYGDLFVTLMLPNGTRDASQQRSSETWIKGGDGVWRLVSHQSTSFQ